MGHLNNEGVERLWANAVNTFAELEEVANLKERVAALEEALASLAQAEGAEF